MILFPRSGRINDAMLDLVFPTLLEPKDICGRRAPRLFQCLSTGRCVGAMDRRAHDLPPCGAHSFAMEGKKGRSRALGQEGGERRTVGGEPKKITCFSPFSHALVSEDANEVSLTEEAGQSV